MGPDSEFLISEIENLCLGREWRVGLAESCTGGLASSLICARPGVSRWFQGAVVSYARTVKEQLLSVPSHLCWTHGEVSLPVAVSMARGARKALDCDWSVSITGVAGPDGGSVEKPVGTVCFAVAGPGVERATQSQFPAGGGRQDIQRQAVLFAFDFLINEMR